MLRWDRTRPALVDFSSSSSVAASASFSSTRHSSGSFSSGTSGSLSSNVMPCTCTGSDSNNSAACFWNGSLASLPRLCISIIASELLGTDTSERSITSYLNTSKPSGTVVSSGSSSLLSGFSSSHSRAWNPCENRNAPASISLAASSVSSFKSSNAATSLTACLSCCVTSINTPIGR